MISEPNERLSQSLISDGQSLAGRQGASPVGRLLYGPMTWAANRVALARVDAEEATAP